jgi:hypothetical protein
MDEKGREFIRFERCENCWWRSGPYNTNAGNTFNECRINPPVAMTGPPLHDLQAVFPRVELTDFCSKFEHRITPKDTP